MEERTYEDFELDPKVASARNELFEKYIAPYYNMIYKLCINYTYNSSNVQENYNEVLVNFYRNIMTYDTSKPICTWIHVVVKRHVALLEKRRKAHNNRNDDQDVEDLCATHPEMEGGSWKAMGVDNYRELYNDDILAVLDSMKPIYRDVVLLQEAGYLLKEIAEIEYEKGSIQSRNIETIKSRLFLARKYMKERLTRDGERKID